MKLPDDLLTELRNLAVCRNDSGWGPNPFVCRWCSCWLYSKDPSDKVVEVHAGAHKKGCLAVKYLGAPTEPRKIRCTCFDKGQYGEHDEPCAMYSWKEPYL